MSRLTQTSHNNPCPICQKTNGNCRIDHQLEMVLCMTHQEDDYQHIGYKFVKPTQDGLWGIYFPITDKGKDYSDPQTSAYGSTTPFGFAQGHTNQRFAQLADNLLVDERDKNIRLLHKYLGLTQSDRQKLRDRGLTPEQLNKGLFFSCSGYTELPDFVDTRLAGVFIGKNGKKYLKGDKNGSIACIAFQDGKAIGWQYRHPRKENKYTWAKGIKSSHLTNGELPLTHLKVAQSQELWITEGILKPYITHHKFGVNVAGASGFNFSGSKEQITAVIRNNEYKKIVVALDAGAIVNPHVMRQFERNVQLFQSLGCDVEIAWWNQITKENKDIDELDHLDDIQLINVDTFYELRTQNSEVGTTNDELRTPNSQNEDYGYDPNFESEFVDSTYTLEQFRKDLDNQEFSEFQAELIKEVNKLSKSFERGFCNKNLVIPDLQPSTYTYHPSRPLPSRLDYKDKNEPLIIIPLKYQCDRPKILMKLKQLGWKHIFDRSQTGSGKSHAIAQLDKVIYLDVNYQNPSIEGIKKFVAMPPRVGKGIYIDNDGRRYVDPSETKIREKDLEIEDDFNCIRKEYFQSLENKGYNAENESLPCLTCPLSDKCKKELFKALRRKAIQRAVSERRLRCHPSQMTTELLSKSFDDFLLVWEEAGAIESIKEIYYSNNDLSSLLADLAVNFNNSENYQKLIKIIAELQKLLDIDKAKKLIDDKRFFGLTEEVILNNLPDIPIMTANELSELNKFYQLTDMPNLSTIDPDQRADYLERNIKANYYPLIQAILLRTQNSELRSQKSEIRTTDCEVQTTLTTEGSVRAEGELTNLSITQNGRLLVSKLDQHSRQLARIAKTNLYIDATASVQQIRGLYNIPEHEPILTIKTEVVKLNNIQVFNINTKGLKSYDWSDYSIKRVVHLIDTIKSQNKNKKIAVMCPKKYCDVLGTPYYYGRDDRGSNELKNYDGIIFVGTPHVNLGSAKRKYELIYGDYSSRERSGAVRTSQNYEVGTQNSELTKNSFTFEQYYNQLLRENRWQGTGRQRGQWHEKQLHQYYIATEEDLSYFSELGMKITEVSAELINPECGSKGDRTLLKIKQSIVSFIEAGKKITLEAIAKTLNMTKQGVSKAIKGFEGGWRGFVKSQLSLIEIYKGKVDQINHCDDWLSVFWKDEPQVIIPLIIETIKRDGFSGFLELIQDSGTSCKIALEILWTLAPLWDERLRTILLL